MNSKKIFISALMLVSALCVNAGGLLTNTNQSIAFLRNPARDAAIGIDGVYSNPAGVAFMKEGFHLNLNWQMAWQTRTINTTNPLLQLGVKNNKQKEKEYEGKAYVPFLPSVQAAYNKGKWSYQFNFGVIGGGGRCEFADGLGSFETAVGRIAYGLQQFATNPNVNYPSVVQAYDCNSYMQGKQYYFGFTLGAAYKLIDQPKQKLSLYAGVRVLYGTATYKAKLDQISVYTSVPGATGLSQQSFKDYYTNIKPYIQGANQAAAAGIAQYQQAGVPVPEALQQSYDATQSLLAVEPYAANDGVNLQSDQSGVGFAPILGADYQVGKFNFAVKYEFRTKVAMENESTVKEAHAIAAINQFRDGTSVREDSPSLLAIGVEYTPIEILRLNGGFHFYNDKASKKYNNKQEDLHRNTCEYLAGAEVDVTKKLTASAGFQITKYGNTDKFINDMSFVVNSWSYGVGVKYQFNDKVALNAAYFKTKYTNYHQDTPDANGSTNTFTRSNRVGGIGVELTF